MLLVCGSLNYDVFMIVDHFAPPKAIVKKLMRYLGGSGGNAAVAAAKILGRGAVGMLGAVGDDKIGRRHIDELRKVGIDTALIKIIKGVESGQAYVALRPDGENAIYSYRGANDVLLPDLISSDDLALISKYEALLLMNPPIETAEYLCRIFKNSGKTVFWDPGALSKLGLSKLESIIRLTDYLLPNHGELLAMTNASSIREAADLIAKVNRNMVLVSKTGTKGSTIIDIRRGKVVSVSAVAPEALGLKTISTVGCGDTYSGVFAASIMLGKDLIEAARMATCAAALKASRTSPRDSPTLNELMEYYDKCCENIVINEVSI